MSKKKNNGINMLICSCVLSVASAYASPMSLKILC